MVSMEMHSSLIGGGGGGGGRGVRDEFCFEDTTDLALHLLAPHTFLFEM